MTDGELLEMLKTDVPSWNRWIASNPDHPAPHFRGMSLFHATVSGANLRGADLQGMDLRGATLTNCDLRGAFLSGANLTGATLIGSTLEGAELDQAILVETDLRGVNLNGCSVYGVSAWAIITDDLTSQQSLRPVSNDFGFTVDRLEIAQFMFLLINNPKIRDVLETVTARTVLILGRFSADRQPILDAVSAELRRLNYVPIVFTFGRPRLRNLTETIVTLAGMARFIIADLTDARSVQQELQAIIPVFKSVPVQAIIHELDSEWALAADLLTRPPYVYTGRERLIEMLNVDVIQPVEDAVKQIAATLTLEENKAHHRRMEAELRRVNRSRLDQG